MLNVMLVGMLLIALFQVATMARRQYLMVHTTRRLDLEMVTAFDRHLLALISRYFEDRCAGDILKRFDKNENIRELLTGRAVGNDPSASATSSLQGTGPVGKRRRSDCLTQGERFQQHRTQ